MVLMNALLTQPMTDEEFQQKINEINQRYQAEYDETQPEQDDLKNDAENCIAEFALDVKWDLTRIAFDIPEVTMNLREMKFHFVKTTFNVKTIASFDVPELRWEITRIGPIKTKVPKWYNKRVEIKTKIPEFKWNLTTIKTKIPEFRKKRIEIKFHILKIMGLKELNIPCKSAETKSNALEIKLDGVAKQHQSEINELTSGYLLEKADEVADQIESTTDQFKVAIDGVDAAILDCRANNVDPGTVTADFEGEKLNLPQVREKLVEARDEALNQLATAHAEIIAAIKQL